MCVHIGGILSISFARRGSLTKLWSWTLLPRAPMNAVHSVCSSRPCLLALPMLAKPWRGCSAHSVLILGAALPSGCSFWVSGRGSCVRLGLESRFGLSFSPIGLRPSPEAGWSSVHLACSGGRRWDPIHSLFGCESFLICFTFAPEAPV